MAGQLTIDTLKASTGVLAIQNGMNGICKAWVNFNGTSGTPAIRGSFNVSSVTAIGTGYWQVNYTTAMPNGNYAVSATASTQPAYANDGSGIACVSAGAGTPTTLTTSVQIITTLVANAGGYNQPSFITSVAVFA